MLMVYIFAMTILRIPNGKPKWIEEIIDDILTFIIKIEILDLIEKQWSRLKKGNFNPIDYITYYDLIQYQNAKIINGIDWESME
jgi:hypothetical protein